MKKNEFTVLYAEDEIDTREKIAEVLRYTFNEVIEADDGEIAYKLYKEKKPDIILADVLMPNMDGMSLVKKIRQRDEDIPIIVLSGSTETNLLLDAVKLRLVDYIIKPVTKDSLKNAFDKALKQLENNDYPTSLSTKKVLEHGFEAIIQKYSGCEIQAGVILVNIDNFSLINKNMGRLFGDKILQQIAKILNQNIRVDDILVRWGGNEFIILLDEIDAMKLKEIAKNLRYIVAHLEFEGYSDFTCSFGIDMLQAEDTLYGLMNRVEKTLFEGKKISKNCVVKYNTFA